MNDTFLLLSSNVLVKMVSALNIATFVYQKHTKWSFGNRHVNFTSLHYLICIKLTAFALIVASCSAIL